MNRRGFIGVLLSFSFMSLSIIFVYVSRLIWLLSCDWRFVARKAVNKQSDGLSIQKSRTIFGKKLDDTTVNCLELSRAKNQLYDFLKRYSTLIVTKGLPNFANVLAWHFIDIRQLFLGLFWLEILFYHTLDKEQGTVWVSNNQPAWTMHCMQWD